MNLKLKIKIKKCKNWMDLQLLEYVFDNVSLAMCIHIGFNFIFLIRAF